MEEYGRIMRLYRKPEIWRLDEIYWREPSNFACHRPHIVPATDMFDHRIRVNHIEAHIRILTEVSSIACDERETRVTDRERRQIQERNVDPSLAEHPLHIRPIIQLTANIEDPAAILIGKDLIKQRQKEHKSPFSERTTYCLSHRRAGQCPPEFSFGSLFFCHRLRIPMISAGHSD